MRVPRFLPLPAWRQAVPFRLGVTSYVYPAEILPNARRLACRAQDIELVLFESRRASNFPDPHTVEQLAQLGRREDCTYTVHFPIDRRLGSPDRTERAGLLRQIRRLLALTAPLDPFAFLLHVEGIGPDAPRARRLRWQRDVLPLLRTIAEEVADPRRICLENLAYPFEWCDPFLDAIPFSVCIDAGHLWQQGCDWRAHLRHYRPRTRVVHLYGTGGTTAHAALDTVPRDLVVSFLRALRGFSGVLTLETFGYEDTRRSIERLVLCVQDIRARRR